MKMYIELGRAWSESAIYVTQGGRMSITEKK